MSTSIQALTSVARATTHHDPAWKWPSSRGEMIGFNCSRSYLPKSGRRSGSRSSSRPMGTPAYAYTDSNTTTRSRHPWPNYPQSFSSALRSASGEARHVALAHSPSPRPFDPSRDTLHVRRCQFGAFAVAYTHEQGSCSWAGKVLHLALALGVANRRAALRLLAGGIKPTLKTISFVSSSFLPPPPRI